VLDAHFTRRQAFARWDELLAALDAQRAPTA
jgi:hypothetical protein